MATALTDPGELARALGVSPRTVRRWRTRSDMPGGAGGPWDARVVASWALSIRSRSADRSVSAGDTAAVHDALRDARTLRERVRAQREARELQELQARLIDRDQIVPMLKARQQAMRRDLFRMARKLGPRLVNNPDGHDIAEQIEAELIRVLSIWSRAPANG